MAEKTEMDPFVVGYCYRWNMSRKPSKQEKSKEQKEDRRWQKWQGDGRFRSWTGAVALAAKVGVGCTVAAMSPVGLLGGIALVGVAAYVLADDPDKAFLAECKKSLFSRGMANSDWQHVEKALVASIQVLHGLNKRCPDLLAATRRCIELVLHARVMPHARRICRYVVETCVAARSEYENYEDETFRRVFQESHKEIKRCWTELNSYQPSDGLGIADRR